MTPPAKLAAALVVPGPPKKPVRLSDGRLVPVWVIDFYPYENVKRPHDLGRAE